MAQSSPPPAPSERGMQVALGAVITLMLAVAAFRWFSEARQPRPVEVYRESSRVDLNQAGRSELMQLPGLGPSRADSILAYRQRHGGFRKPDELRSVDGIGQVTWERLEPFVYAGPVGEPSDDEPARLQRKPQSSPVAKQTPTHSTRIDLNRATLEQLDTLPGIGGVLAQRIIDERERRPFAKVEDLRRVSGIGVKRLEQIRALVTVTAE